ncbi:MAG: PP2C family protein-serine/threonine phosphatase [Terriglobia bacterium]
MPTTSSGARRPQFSVAWASAVSLLGLALSVLLGATGLSLIFAVLALAFLSVLGWRALAVARNRLLWRLRNRLLVSYVFVGLIPVVLLLLMGFIAAYVLYGNVAAALVTDRFEGVQEELEEVASNVAAALEVAGAIEERLRPALVARIVDAHTAAVRQKLPAAEVHVLGNSLPAAYSLPAWLRAQDGAVVVIGESAELVSTRQVRVQGEAYAVAVSCPLDPTILERLGQEIGKVTLRLLGEEGSGPGTFRVGSQSFVVTRSISDERALPAPVAWWDRTVGFVASQPTRWRKTGEPGSPLVLLGQSRVSLLNRQLASGLGEFSGVPLVVLTFFGVLFLALELVALWIGVSLMRTITTTVNDLQVATEQVQATNFSHRIRVRGRDQLSGLAHAFNSMTASIERLIQESKEKQRLQNELEIARQVQEQLFPRKTPELKTLELVGRCRAARVVSGDYYDYGLAAEGKLMFTIGDISGKGISAALLMATIQSILRTQVYASRLLTRDEDLKLAELVSRVNRQLCATTSTEKYSTLFVGLYDDATRRLTYTNAGHLDPIVLGRNGSQVLSVGGPVVGLFSDLHYEQATIQLEPGDWFVAYTDGLTEVENSYEEEYGSERLVAFLERTADNRSPERLVDAVLAELQQWAPGSEQSDDRTLLVARIR